MRFLLAVAVAIWAVLLSPHLYAISAFLILTKISDQIVELKNEIRKKKP